MEVSWLNRGLSGTFTQLQHIAATILLFIMSSVALNLDENIFQENVDNGGHKDDFEMVYSSLQVGTVTPLVDSSKIPVARCSYNKRVRGL